MEGFGPEPHSAVPLQDGGYLPTMRDSNMAGPGRLEATDIASRSTAGACLWSFRVRHHRSARGQQPSIRTDRRRATPMNSHHG